MSLSGTPFDPVLYRQYGPDLLVVVHEMLQKCRNNGLKIVTAESLTGGGIASLLSALNGSSNMLDGGFVVYNNQFKAARLGVSEEDLRIHEAVSAPVAEQMARGALERSNAHVAVAVTGYAAETGDENRNIPGGTVFIGLVCREGLAGAAQVLEVMEKHFTPERTACRAETIEAAIQALDRAIDYLISKKPDVQTSGPDLTATGEKKRVEVA